MSKIYNKLNNDFTQVPNKILLDTNISGLAYKIYSYICFRIGINAEWEFYNDEISSHFKEGRDAFLKAKKQLIQYGYLVKVKQNHKGKQGFSGCDYIIYKDPIINYQTTEIQETDNQTTEIQHTNNIDTTNKDNNNIDSNIHISKNKKKIKEVKDINDTSKVEIISEKEMQFKELWDLYGHIGNRKMAERNFNKIKDIDINEMKNKIIEYKQFLENKRKTGFNQNQKHFSTWLNQESWKDELQIENTQSQRKNEEERVEAMMKLFNS